MTRITCGIVIPSWKSAIAAALDERVERHDVKAAEDADQREVGEDAPVRGLALQHFRKLSFARSRERNITRLKPWRAAAVRCRSINLLPRG